MKPHPFTINKWDISTNVKAINFHICVFLLVSGGMQIRTAMPLKLPSDCDSLRYYREHLKCYSINRLLHIVRVFNPIRVKNSHIVLVIMPFTFY